MANYEAKFNKNGNIKVGKIWTWNKLAGSGVIAGCKGTCGKHCTGCYKADNPKKSPCYVFKAYVLYGWDTSTVVASHVRNTNAMRNNIDKAFKELALQLSRAKNPPSVVRIHSAGELESADELINWFMLAEKFPAIHFYIYTKAYECLTKALDICHNKIPDNFFINVSIWHEEGLGIYNKYKHLTNIRAFVYDDGYNYNGRLDYNCYCPAYKKNEKGKVVLKHDLTCDKCGICFSDKAKVCACLDH